MVRVVLGSRDAGIAFLVWVQFYGQSCTDCMSFNSPSALTRNTKQPCASGFNDGN